MKRSGRFAAVLPIALAVCAGCSRDGDSHNKKRDLVGAPVAEPGAGRSKSEATDAFAKMYRDAFVVDLIQDFVFRKRRDGWSLASGESHMSLDRQRQGGVDLVLAALPGGSSPDPAQALEDDLATMETLVAETGGRAKIVRGLAEAREVAARGVLPVMLLLEGADAVAVGDVAENVAKLKARGVAVLGIVGERGNAFSDAAASPSESSGLTEKGAALVQVLKSQGVLVDLTHGTAEAFWDALVEGNAVVSVTHTAVGALREHPRNLTDLQIIALSRAGGVLGLVFNPDFLRSVDPSAASMDDLVAHAKHVKRIGATKALALGTDFGGVIPPRGAGDVSALPGFATRLLNEGFTSEEILDVFGRNALRVLEAAEAGQGAAESSNRAPLRPIPLECDGVSGPFGGVPASSCDGFVADGGTALEASTVQKLRLNDMSLTPSSLEIFGEPQTPWQVEAQDLSGKVLLRRIVALDAEGKGEMPMPRGQKLVRLFLSPTRASRLREAVVWGR